MPLTREQLLALTREERQNLARYRSATVGTFNAENRTVEISFASQTPCPDYWGDAEVLRCTEESMNTERFEQGVMPILFNHKRDEVIGKPLKIWCENGVAKATIQFAETEKAKEIMGMVRDGFLKGVSVGYRVSEWEFTPSGQISKENVPGPCYTANRWEVFEASIVSVPADATVGVRSLPFPDDGELNIVDKTRKEGNQMANVIEPQARSTQEPTPAPAPVVNNDEAVRAAQTAERERCSQILGLCGQFNIEDAQRDAWINGNASVEAVNRELLGILATRNAPAPAPAPVQVGPTASEQMRAAYRDSLLLRHGFHIEKPADGARDMVGMPVKDMAREMLSREGEKNIFRMSDDELFKRAMTTGNFSDLLNDTVKASMLTGYNEAQTTFEAFTTAGTLNDFKVDKRYILDGADEPELVPENGEFKHAELGSNTVNISLTTDGIAFAYTRQLFINDDMGVLTAMPAKYAAAFRRKINRLCYGALAGISYSAKNSNLVTTGAAPSTDSLTAARQLLRKQKDMSGKYNLNLTPAFLIVPTKHETIAAQLIRSEADPTGANSGVYNVFRNSLNLVVDAALDTIDEDAWYMMAAKGQTAGIEVAYLRGNKTPQLESKAAWDTLGMNFRMYLDFGIKALDHRGFVKNAGK